MEPEASDPGRFRLSWQDPRWIYVVGRVNSGKSTFVNRFLWYIGYRPQLAAGCWSFWRHQGAVHYKRAVGGVTRSPVSAAHFPSGKHMKP